MRRVRNPAPLHAPAILLLAMLSESSLSEEALVDFNRDIRPVLAAKCFACHGPDEEHRESGLRLDVRQEAVDYGAIAPGAAEDSELVRRILSDDPDEVMPPPSMSDALTDDQRKLFIQWIEQGAAYSEHWAFQPPQNPTLPRVRRTDWPRNEIDYFVLARLETEGIKPAPEADAYALVRRVYLDLTGLPPTPEEADAFVCGDDPLAYEQLVDELLGSKRYGERWARQWLDLARYADTHGYEKDRERSIWPYRDWVIRALNADMPFDQFTIEQIAGDMLPHPTQDQLTATGFHRNTMLNEEGGIDPLEYRFYAMVDRVATTGTVWLGLSTGCAQCHTHKYDPITHVDYYRLFALLNNADEPDLVVKSPELEARRWELKEQILALEAELPRRFPLIPGDEDEKDRRAEHLELKFEEWLHASRLKVMDWRTLSPLSLETNSARLQVLPDGSIFSTGDITKRDVFRLSFQLDETDGPISAIRLEVLPDERLPAGGPGRAFYEGRKGDFFLSEIDARVDRRPIAFSSPSHSYGKISIGSGDAQASNVLDGDGSTGWSTAEREGESHQLVLNLAEPIQEGEILDIELLFERHFAASLGRFRFSATSSDRTAEANEAPIEIERILTIPAAALQESQRRRLRAFYLSVVPELADARKPIAALQKQIPDYPTTMILRERPADHPRITYRRRRGEYLEREEEIAPGLPEFLAERSLSKPTNRLEFARWLVSDENPLVARVAVNRAWQGIFGAGLQRSSDDFGTQSDPPTHPLLLDWLARDFVDHQWSMKHLHRLIVTSAAYRQSSRLTSEGLQRDPENRLLARGPRFRIPAEMIRDVMLHSSDLLSEKMYGPGVRPPQPGSVTATAYGSPAWNASEGEDVYRRSLYTFNKRTAPFAAYAVFDAPSGESCIARRDRSNTPLQALTLLNDEMFLEASRALAAQATERATSDEEAAKFIFRRLLIRPPAAEELSEILLFYDAQLARISMRQLDAREISGNASGTQAQAAWAMVARVLMNLDETITKP